MRNVVRFLCLCFQATFTEIHGRADLWTGAVAALGGLLPWYLEKYHPKTVAASILQGVKDMPDWIYFFVALGAVLFVRLLLSPFWVWKDAATERDALLSSRDDYAARMKRAEEIAKWVTKCAATVKQMTHAPKWDGAKEVAALRKGICELIGTFEHPQIYSPV